MQLQPTEEQSQMAQALRRWIERTQPAPGGRLRGSDPGARADAWAALSSLGLPALLVPQALGGLGASRQDALQALEALAPALLPEPVASSCVLATLLLVLGVDGTATRGWLREMALGRCMATPAVFEPAADFDLDHPQTRAVRDAGGWRIDGEKTRVLQAPSADLLLVSARVEDGGLGWFGVPADSAGLELRPCTLFDGQAAADLSLRAVPLDAQARIDAPGSGTRMAAELRATWLAALCAEAVGLLQAVVDATVRYLNTREQFGAPIGRLQALQHRAADLWMELEQARSMAWLAADACAGAQSRPTQALLAAAKARVGQACRRVSQESIQLHGGMGMTDELPVSHWFRRLTTIELWLGDSDAHLQQVARAELPCQAD